MAYKTRGVVIRRVVFDENDLILTVFTERAGKLTVFSNGARNPKNAKASGSQLFAHSELEIYMGKNSNTLYNADVIGGYYPLREDFEKLAYGSYFLELVDFTHKDGQVSRPVYELLVEVLDHGPGMVELSVTDNGVGIDPRYHRRIFDKFFQVEDRDRLPMVPGLLDTLGIRTTPEERLAIGVGGQPQGIVRRLYGDVHAVGVALRPARPAVAEVVRCDLYRGGADEVRCRDEGHALERGIDVGDSTGEGHACISGTVAGWCEGQPLGA